MNKRISTNILKDLNISPEYLDKIFSHETASVIPFNWKNSFSITAIVGIIRQEHENEIRRTLKTLFREESEAFLEKLGYKVIKSVGQ